MQTTFLQMKRSCWMKGMCTKIAKSLVLFMSVLQDRGLNCRRTKKVKVQSRPMGSDPLWSSTSIFVLLWTCTVGQTRTTIVCPYCLFMVAPNPWRQRCSPSEINIWGPVTGWVIKAVFPSQKNGLVFYFYGSNSKVEEYHICYYHSVLIKPML